jgi:hypothetical protein
MSLLFSPDLCVERHQYDAFIARMAATRADAAAAVSAAEAAAEAAAAAAAERGEEPPPPPELPVVPDESNAVWPMLLWR